MFYVVSIIWDEDGTIGELEGHTTTGQSVVLMSKYELRLARLLQYTGLKDSTKWEQLSTKEQSQWIANSETKESWNGKEIYEGDIVKYADDISHWDGGYTTPTLVEFDSGSFNPFCGCGGEYAMNVEMAVIIGNIHENPELINPVVNQ